MDAYRSVLFVPGHKRDWIEKAMRSSADAVIIDLEDAVPETEKALARDNARDALTQQRAGRPPGMLVRVNALDTGHSLSDLLAVARQNLAGVLLPKLFGRDDMIRFDALTSAAEDQNGLARGTIALVPTFETSRSIAAAGEICRAPRVEAVMAAAARDADVAREVGFRWSAAGLETLFLRSSILLEARAAGIRNIWLGLWQEIRDLDGLAEFAHANRDLGYTGQVIIHPSHAEPVNDAFGVTEAELRYYERLVAAVDEGIAQGSAAVLLDGEHIDIAHANHARSILQTARAQNHNGED